MNYIYYRGNQTTKEIQPIKLLQVYNNQTTKLDTKIVEFWINEKAFPNTNPKFIKQRLNEVLFITLNEKDEIVGISSGAPVFFDQIREHFLYFRLFVRADYRGENKGVAIGMYYATFDLFDQLKEIADQKVIGILIVYESAHLNKVINYYHSETYRNQVFVGWTANNEQIRITYFNNLKMF